jgi:hypothetical protein
MWLGLLVLSACERNACVEMCQAYKRWIDACGSSWEAAFPDRDWHSVEDCYDAQWDADTADQKACAKDAQRYEQDACY